MRCERGVARGMDRHPRGVPAGWRAWLMVFVLGLPLAGHAAATLDGWRNDIREARALAENDAPAAYRQALKLQDTLPAAASPADRVSVLNLLARTETYLMKTEPAERHVKEALALAQQHGDRIGQIEADLTIATVSVHLGNIRDLISASTDSLALLDGVDRPDLLGESLLRTAVMYRRIGLMDVSVTMCMQLMEIAKRNRNPMALAYAHQCLGISFDQTDHRVQAISHYKQMLLQSRQAHSKLMEAYANVGVGRMLANAGDSRQGESYVREAIRLFREIGTPSGEAHGLFSLAEQLSERGRYAEAIALYLQVLRIYEQHPSKIGIWFTHNALSLRYQAVGNIADARRYADQAYALAKDIGLGTYLHQSALRLAQLESTKGNYRTAYAYAAEADEMRSKAERELSGERMLQLASRYEAESRQRHVEELTRRNEQQATEIRQRTLRQRWLWTVLGGSLVMLAGSAFFLLRLRRSHGLLATANSQLRRSQEQVRALNIGLEQRVQSRTAELRQQTRYLRTLIDMLPMLAWFKDAQSRFLVVNQAVADSSGHPVETMIGKTDLDYWPGELAESYRADDREVMATRSRKTVEEQLTDAGGTIWIETYKAPVVDEDGTVLGTVGVARDISAQKATEAAREAALAEAERLARMRSQFLAQMSHELRTPLNGILGYAQIMRRNKALDERQIDALNVIQQSGEHLLMLINDILEFAKIDAGKMELNPNDMALDKFLRTIVSIISVRAEQKHLEFSVELAPDLPAWVRLDEKRLRQVLLNLLANAVKFTDAGEVRLLVGVAGAGRLRFEVRDSGIGIAPEQLETIFQPFEQTGEMHRRAAGTGLGLAISRQLVRLMGSDIRVESRLGQGSTFSFELEAPVAEAWIAPPPAEARVTGYAGPRKRVLVVDDVAENRAVAIDMLAPLGFEMVEAANGVEALEQAQLQPPDLILMDIVMPEMDGLEATRRLRQLPGFDEVPIIAISASTSSNDERSSLAVGVNVFLTKPIDFDKLLANVAQLLQLDWRYELPGAGIAVTAIGPFVAPPGPEMEILHRMALQGNMRDIQQMASRLTGMDERYRAFADHLRTLAKGYRSKAILTFVERYLERGTSP